MHWSASDRWYYKWKFGRGRNVLNGRSSYLQKGKTKKDKIKVLLNEMAEFYEVYWGTIAVNDKVWGIK